MFSRWDALLAGLVFLVALWVNLSAVAMTEFHRDEARWIHRARFLEELRNPTGEFWRESELMIGQPPLGSYLMGLGLTLQGRDLDTNGFYNFHFGPDWNRRHGTMPDEADLAAGRRTNSVVGALIAVCVYLIARGLSNPVAGIAAAALLVPHPLSIYLSSLAGIARPGRAPSCSACCSASAAPPSSVRWRSPWCWRRRGSGMVLVIHGWRGSGWAARHDGMLGWRLLVQPPLASATFIASYPYLWPDPIGRTRELFEFRAIEMYNQGVLWSELYVDGPVDALGRIGNWLGDIDSVTGQLFELIARPFGISWKPMEFDLVLAIIGALILLVLAIQRGLGSRWAMATLVLGGQVALIVVGMRADFSRYLLPVLTATAVCGGLVAGAVWDVAWDRMVRRRESRRPVVDSSPLAGEPVSP
ncbi:MAG: hypothetical protein K0S78_4914 [Thermomicrobiales bacterium]|nr:hypothetical protein [Thermomicrobiales bacterium]